MSSIKHYQFGYLNQILSIFFLFLNLIILPNVLNVETYAQLILYLSFIGIASMIINESASLVVINKYATNSGGDVFATFIRSNIEHALLSAFVFFLYLFLFGYELLSRNTLTVLFLCVLAQNYYVLVCAYFIGTKKNHIVSIFSILTGIINFILPISLFFMKIDMLFVVIGQCFTYILIASIFMPFKNIFQASTRGLWKEKMFFSSEFFNLLIAIGIKPLVVWFPVIFYSNNGMSEESTSYRIAIGIIMASLSFIPYNKLTLLSLQDTVSETLSKYVSYAKIIGLLIVLCFYFLSQYIYLIFPQYTSIDSFLLMLSPIPFLMLFFDIAIVKLTASKKLIFLSIIPIFAIMLTVLLFTFNSSLNFINYLLTFFIIISVQSIYHSWMMDRKTNKKLYNNFEMLINLFHLLALALFFILNMTSGLLLVIIFISFLLFNLLQEFFYCNKT